MGFSSSLYAVLTHVINRDFIQKRIQIFHQNRLSQSNGNEVKRKKGGGEGEKREIKKKKVLWKTMLVRKRRKQGPSVSL